MKQKTLNTILVVVVVLLIAGILGFYLYDVLLLKTPYSKNLFRVLAVVFLLLGTLVRLAGRTGRGSLAVYEKAYADEIQYAFKDRPFQRKKLLCACRLYSESNYGKALKYLFRLLRQAESERDAIPVLLFIALCYSDAGLPDDAIGAYYDLLKLDSNHARVHNNMGRLLVNKGDYETALKHYNKSIELQPKNYYAYVNRANYYFRDNQYEEAIADAKQALEFKNNGVEAANLLTIIYALLDDEENKKYYYHISVAAGQRPEELNDAIEYFLHEENIPSYEEEEELDDEDEILDEDA